MPDQRGYNLSDKPAGIASYSIDLLASDVVGVLDTVTDSKAFVVGHDWGAGVAWYLAARYSERVSRTAMLSVPHPRIFIKNLIMNPAQLRRSWYTLFFQLPWLPECILRRRDWALLVGALRDTSPPGVFSDSDLEQYKKSWARKGALTAMLNWYRAALLSPSKFAVDPEASRVKVPALLIWGRNSYSAPTDNAQSRLRRMIPEMKKQCIPAPSQLRRIHDEVLYENARVGDARHHSAADPFRISGSQYQATPAPQGGPTTNAFESVTVCHAPTTSLASRSME